MQGIKRRWLLLASLSFIMLTGIAVEECPFTCLLSLGQACGDDGSAPSAPPVDPTGCCCLTVPKLGTDCQGGLTFSECQEAAEPFPGAEISFLEGQVCPDT